MANYQNLKAAISAAIRTNGNQEITGQVLQDVLNSIVSVIGANYTFAGVATPATNPGTPDQNVMYLAMEGGTYTNFNGTVLPAGISLLIWNGSWTSETVMCGDGGVFDISVYKSSGGTLATFADLAAALDGGNNIPASARKGGMSVKFVQSSDNKYVQYMLVKDEWSASEGDWEKMNLEEEIGKITETILFERDLTSTAGTTQRGISLSAPLTEDTPVSLEYEGIVLTKVAVLGDAYLLLRDEFVSPSSGMSFLAPAGTSSFSLYFDALPAQTHYSVRVVARNARAWGEGAWDKASYLIGNPENLTTEEKGNLVSAVNEVNGKVDGINLKVSDAPDRDILVNTHYNVPSGESQKTASNIVSGITDDTYGSILISVDCTMTFYDSSWHQVGSPNVLTANQFLPILIPKNANKAIFVLPSVATSQVRIDVLLLTGTLATKVNDNKLSIDRINGFLGGHFPEITLLNHSYKISAGEYRYNISFQSIDEYIPAYIVLSGIDGSATFYDYQYGYPVTYSLSDGVETYIQIPPRRPKLMISTLNDVPVASTTKFNLLIKYIRDANGLNEYQKRVDDRKYLPVLNNMNRTKLDTTTNNPSTLYKTLVLQSLADSHDNLLGVSEFLEFNDRYGDYIQDMIGLGDYYAGGLNIALRSPSIPGWERIIKTIGNHDAYSNWGSSPLEIASESDVYDAVLVRDSNNSDIAQWGVTYQEGKTYFYKDYEDANVRVIFIDYMHWDDTNDADGQIAWLNGILGITNNVAITKHVLIVMHYRPVSVLSGVFVPFASKWMDADFPYGRRETGSAATPEIGGFDCTLPDIIKAFQDLGGNFIAYLCGHEHISVLGKLQNYQQLIYAQQTECPNVIRPNAFMFDTDWIKQFCIYSIDTEMKYLRIYKVGTPYDRNMRLLDSILLKYGSEVSIVTEN